MGQDLQAIHLLGVNRSVTTRETLALDTGAFSERHMRQRAAVSGFRINELNAAAPVLLTMTRTGALGAKKATSGLSAPARAIKPRKVGSSHPGCSPEGQRWLHYAPHVRLDEVQRSLC